MKLTWAKLLFLAWVFVFSISSIPSLIEGKLYPAADNTHIVRMISDDGYTPMIAITFNIKRQCEIKNARIYYKVMGGLKENYITTPLLHKIQKDSSYGTAIINIPGYIYYSMSKMYILSDCHALWYTATKIYG